MGKNIVREHGSSSMIEVDVVPGSTKTALGKVNEWRGSLQIKVAAQPREGAANEELIRFLAAALGLPKDSVRIMKGETSRHKTIMIDAPVDKVMGLLEEPPC